MDVGGYAMQFLIDGVLIESNNICSECTFIVSFISYDNTQFKTHSYLKVTMQY